MGIGDLGFGLGQIPNPQSPRCNNKISIFLNSLYKKNINKIFITNGK